MTIIQNKIPPADQTRRRTLHHLALALYAAFSLGALIRATAAPSPEVRLAGAWSLAGAYDILADGTRFDAYGSNPQGLLIVDSSGRYSLQIFRPERPKFASGDKLRGTPEEYQAAVLGTSTHIGRCTIDEANSLLTFHIEFASFPNLDGVEQKRSFKLVGDELSYRIPPKPDGRISISVWRRIRD